MSHVLKLHLQEKARQREEDAVRLASLREQNRRLIEDIDGSKIYSTELVNCLPNGKVQTVNSMKYPTREIKEKLGIQFKFHFLRHTYGTMMAEKNTPTHLLRNQMGHGSIHVTQKYYIADGILKIMEADFLRLMRHSIQTAAHGLVDRADAL